MTRCQASGGAVHCGAQVELKRAHWHGDAWAAVTVHLRTCACRLYDVRTNNTGPAMVLQPFRQPAAGVAVEPAGKPSVIAAGACACVCPCACTRFCLPVTT